MSLRVSRLLSHRTASPAASARVRNASQAWLWWWNDSPAAADVHPG